MIKNFLDPTRVFISLLIAVAFWIAPFGLSVEQFPAAGQIQPIKEYSEYPKLVLAIVSEVSAACANKCKEPVCLKWVPPGGSCQPSNPWDIGCCTKWGTVCNEDLPGCGPQEPPPPPAYSPPTVSAALTCAAWGNLGWCVNNGKVAITAADPQGFIVTISGNVTVSGVSTPFSCGNPCSLNMPSGSGSVTYSATAATSGLSSAAGNISFKFDPGNPVITSSVSGTQSGGWRTTAGATVTVLSSDAVSGLQFVSITRNGIDVSSPFSLPEGTHDITVVAADVAGNQSTSSFTVKVDSVKPLVSFGLTGLAGEASWYKSATVVVDVTDATSGVQTLIITDNGFVKSSPMSLFDGIHSIVATATDNAGNVQSSSYNIQVDGTPPSIVPSITGTAGENGWYVSGVTIQAANSDATSAIASEKFRLDGGAWQAGTGITVSLDGVHSVDFLAIDNAGNQATDSITINVDTVPPAQLLVLNGTTGLNNWYVSDVLAAVAATDATSGNVVTTITDNGGTAQSGPITLTEGLHNLQYVTVDAAGNSVSASALVSVDTTAPTNVFSSPASNSVGMDTIQIGGQSADLTSGLSSTQISFDNVNWLSLPQAPADWSYAWDTADLPNGAMFVFARSIDQAGNTGTAAQIHVILNNHPPFLSLSDSWNIWESGDLSVQPNVTPLKSVRIVVQDPMLRYADEVIYDDLPAPKAVSWDRVIGPGSAPPGSYIISVEACDIYGLCSKDSGTILIPVPPTSIPFQLPVIEIPKWIPPIPFLPAPVPEQPVAVVPVALVLTHADAKIVPTSAWITVVISALLLAFAFLLLLDPRPKAWRSLTRSLHQHIQHFKE